MNDDPTPRDDERPADEAEWQRKRRIAAVFGDVLPDTTTDEQDTDTHDQGDEAQDRWLRSQVPPHHG